MILSVVTNYHNYYCLTKLNYSYTLAEKPSSRKIYFYFSFLLGPYLVRLFRMLIIQKQAFNDLFPQP